MGTKIKKISNEAQVSFVFGCISLFIFVLFGALTLIHSFHTVKNHEVKRLDSGVYRNHVTIKANINGDVKIDTLDTINKKSFLVGENYMKYDSKYYGLLFCAFFCLILFTLAFILLN